MGANIKKMIAGKSNIPIDHVLKANGVVAPPVTPAIVSTTPT